MQVTNIPTDSEISRTTESFLRKDCLFSQLQSRVVVYVSKLETLDSNAIGMYE